MSSYIEVKNVSKSFGGKAILQDVSLSIEQEQLLVWLALTAAESRCCSKFYAVSRSLIRAVFMCAENSLVKMAATSPKVWEYLSIPRFYWHLQWFSKSEISCGHSRKIGEKEIRQAMGKVGLDPDNKTKVDNYSLGMKQKLGIAQAIMEGQDILILDEPFNALDYKTYEDVKAIIRMLKAEGKTIFLTSHHFKDIEQLCDQVYSIEDCRLIPITEEIAARYREME